MFFSWIDIVLVEALLLLGYGDLIKVIFVCYKELNSSSTKLIPLHVCCIMKRIRDLNDINNLLSN